MPNGCVRPKGDVIPGVTLQQPEISHGKERHLDPARLKRQL